MNACSGFWDVTLHCCILFATAVLWSVVQRWFHSMTILLWNPFVFILVMQVKDYTILYVKVICSMQTRSELALFGDVWSLFLDKYRPCRILQNCTGQCEELSVVVSCTSAWPRYFLLHAWLKYSTFLKGLRCTTGTCTIHSLNWANTEEPGGSSCCSSRSTQLSYIYCTAFMNSSLCKFVSSTFHPPPI